MELRKLPDTNTCPNCGDQESFMLARDITEYSPLVFVDGQWVTGYSDMQYLGIDDKVYCTHCGTYFEVPEEL